jgi:hypothetical protein
LIALARPAWQQRLLEMFTTGKTQRDPASGKGKRNPATGKVIRSIDTNDTCCCDGDSTPTPCYYFARRCHDDVETGWSLPCPLATPFYARKSSNGICYKFVDPSIETAGTDFSASFTLTDCTDASCTDEIPPDDPLPPPNNTAFNECCPVDLLNTKYPTVTLTAGGNFDCPDLWEITTEPAWDAKLAGTPDQSNCSWGAAPGGVESFGERLIMDCSVGCQPAGSLGFESQGGWLLDVNMFGRSASWTYAYRKFGGTHPGGSYSLWTLPATMCETDSPNPGGSAPGSMVIG